MPPPGCGASEAILKPLYAIYAGGALHVGWALFHLAFPRVFKWKKNLADTDPVNRNVYQVVNLCLTFWFAAVAYLSFVFGPELLAGGLGRKLLSIITAFWLMRLGLQFKFFNGIHPVSLLLILFFLATMACYGYPLLSLKGA